MNSAFPTPKRLMIGALLLAGWFGLAGCDDKQSTTATATTAPSVATDGAAQSLPTVSMTLGNRPFTIEVAADDATREIGLMHRSSMPADHGMIFAFPTEQGLSFWMKNTLIPLDIVYMNGGGKIVSIQSMKAQDLTSIESGAPTKYAIELNVGVATAAGLKVGDVIQVPSSVTAAAK